MAPRFGELIYRFPRIVPISMDRTWRRIFRKLERGGATSGVVRSLTRITISDRRRRGRLPALAFAAVASFHFATAWVGGPAPNWHGQTSDYYPLLADAFLAGQTRLLETPHPELLA